MSQFNNIKITPNIGINSDPKIEFVGAGNSTITLKALNTTNGGITFEGQKGELLSLVDADVSVGSSVPSFAVNDFYGVPLIQAYQNGKVLVAPYGLQTVGIGTTNPSAKLEVTPTSTSIAGLFSGTTSSDMVRITQLGTGNALVVEDSTNPDATPFVVGAGGSVGIGTTNPIQPFQVGSGSSVVVIDTIGEIGIGTTNPTVKLDVVGDGKFTGVVTAARFSGDVNAYPFYAGISSSVYASPTGTLTPIITLPSTSNRRYIIHSINVANKARKQPQGASATVSISTTTGGVSSVTLTNPGAGYTAGDLSSLDGYSNAIRIGFATVSFVGVGTTGDPAYAGITSALGVGIVILTQGAVTGIVTVNTGAGYTAGDVGITSVVFNNTGTGGVGAAATVAIDTVAGIVTNYTITNPGTGYTVAPLVTITAPIGGGTQATATAKITLGIVTSTFVTYPGFAYTTAPAATFPAPLATGVTTAITATGIGTLKFGEVTAAFLNTPGEGYTTPPTVSIASTTGTGAQITADVDSDGRVIRLNLLNRGFGYSRNNALGNNEENEVYITLPGLAKTEVAVDVAIDRLPVGGATTVQSYLAFNTPIPVGGVVEILKQPAVLNPRDQIQIRGVDVDGSGLSNAIDVCISYEETTNTNYIGYGTVTGANLGLGTAITNIGIISATTSPILLQSLRLTNTEFVGDYDASIMLVRPNSLTFNASVNSTISAGSTVLFVDNLTNNSLETVVTTGNLVTVGTALTNVSITSVGGTFVTIGSGSTVNASISIGTTAIFTVDRRTFLARNLMIPAYASIELCDTPKRIETGNILTMNAETVGIDANLSQTIDIQVAAKNITL